MTDATKSAVNEMLSFHKQVADWQLAQFDAMVKQQQAALEMARNALVTQRDFAQNLGKTMVDAAAK